MINLPKVTLICIDTINTDHAYKVLKYCSKDINFGAVKLVGVSITNANEGWLDGKVHYTNLKRGTNWNEYNDLVLHMNQYIDTDYCLLVQSDGFIINPHLWNDEWFNYDCIGAPWPDQESWLKRQTPRLQKCFTKDTRVGNGGFTFRSKKFLELSDKLESCHGLGEDNMVCCENYQYMVDNGMKFAPPEVAINFSVENPVREMGVNDWQDTSNPLFNTNNSFGFHGTIVPNYSELISRII